MAKKIDRTAFIEKIRFEFGAIREITRPQVLEICDKYGMDRPNWILNDIARRVGRGVYALPENGATPMAKVQDAKRAVMKPFPDLAPKVPTVAMAPSATVAMVQSSVAASAEITLVPEKATG